MGFFQCIGTLLMLAGMVGVAAFLVRLYVVVFHWKGPK